MAGFYGKVINYLTKAFGKIKVGEITLTPKDYEDTLSLTSDENIVITGDSSNKQITFGVSDVLEKLPDRVTTLEEDVETLQEYVGEPSTESTAATGLFEDVKEIRDIIGSEEDKTGIYGVIEQTKNDILGEGISDTFDTLVEIENWIEQSGVDTVELTEALAKEAAERKSADEALADTISSEAETRRVADNQLQINIDNLSSHLAEEISKLDYSNDQGDGYYVVNVSQTDGVISPVYGTLPFGSDAKASYKDGNLRLPIGMIIEE